jgi:bifunctional DNA-binding transcriptional regulator/antitoxin component of YhaV-PrlF toxin-antitoxin module
MIGPDGKQYSIPANYASKSKLVEGDTLKLTIMSDGSFVYKQIGPVERKRILGTLIKDESTNEFSVLANSKAYKVLLASITYFKGGVGDEVVILVPKERESDWAAVENIIKKFNQGNSREQLNIDDLG